MKTFIALNLSDVFKNSVEKRPNLVEFVLVYADTINQAKVFISKREPRKSWGVSEEAPFINNIVIRQD